MTAAEQIETTFREEHGRILAALISRFGDFTLAEDALQDALVNALERWESDGVPRNPGAWLLAVARRRLIDRMRRTTTQERTAETIAMDPLARDDEEPDMDHSIPDDRLKLMFTCCHPALSQEAQVALTLHTLGRLSIAEVARAFLVPVPTMAQRLARARAKIHNAGIPYRVPPADLLPERLEALLAVIYLIFNEGYAATSGDRPIRGELCGEAIRLCRVLVDLLPGSAEARGLLALMLLHDSRREARLDAAGELVLLDEQDRLRWDQAKIRQGIAVLDEALALSDPGPYQVQAAISALHAEAAARGRDRLAADRGALSHAGCHDALACGRGQPGGSGCHGAQSRRGFGAAAQDPGGRGVLPLPRRPRRPAAAHEPARGRRRGLPAGAGFVPEQRRTRLSAAPAGRAAQNLGRRSVVKYPIFFHPATSHFQGHGGQRSCWSLCLKWVSPPYLPHLIRNQIR